MLIREQKQTKKSAGVFISLTIHAVLVALLFLALTEKRLADGFFTHQNQSLIPDVTKDKEAEKDSTQEESSSSAKVTEDKKALEELQKKQPTLNQPFVVPAPVVFYGNQAMMNKPVPVSGHSEGKSAFEHTPSALPTPPAPAIAPERTPSISAPQSLIADAMKDKQEQSSAAKVMDDFTALEREQEKIEEIEELKPDLQRELHQEEGNLLLALEGVSNQPSPKASSYVKTSEDFDDRLPRKKQQQSQSLITDVMKDKKAKKLTLADLFKNATSTIASFAQDGLPSARKAGTEGGDDQGSGHQITIKEGDMKYYTLWAKFLNHLNQAARFNRRGKEGMIQAWMNNKEIQYILQCGITIDMQGKILDIEIMVSSGCAGFDKLCISDIRSAVPYPPLPESLGKKTARFEVNVYP